MLAKRDGEIEQRQSRYRTVKDRLRRVAQRFIKIEGIALNHVDLRKAQVQFGSKGMGVFDGVQPVRLDAMFEDRLGAYAGAGAELKLTDRWSVRGEYRYLRFNLDRKAANVFASTDVGFASLGTNSNTSQTRTDLHLGKVGVAYTFCYCD